MKPLKNLVREALLKQQPRKYDYGCVMVNLKIDPAKWAALQDIVDEKDVYFGDDEKGFGREMKPHVTVLFGIHDDVPDADVEKLIKKIKEPEIELKDVSSFDNKLFDVLKFDIHSKDLVKLNTMFKQLPYTSDFPDYHPHATICYLKPGLAKKYIPKFKDIDPLEADTDKVLFSKADGDKKEYPL